VHKSAQTLVVRRLPRSRRKGLLSLGPITVPCALGKAGVSASKREGDGATPFGRFEILYGYYRADRLRRPVTGVPLRPVSPHDGWCDDPGHPRYNRHVELPFPASHECLWRADHLYDIVLVLNCNYRPAVRGRGSAIFFHLAREGYLPTEGCVAVSKSDMLRVLAGLEPGAVLSVDRW